MKKNIKKIVILIVCVYMAICQINIQSLSYTNDEIKDIIEFKTVEEDGEPEKYDVEIKKEDLQDDIKFPVIQASLDYVLYGEGEYSNINFFGLKSTKYDMNLKYVNNTEKSKSQARWDKISNMVKDFLKVAIYISAATCLTLLIYFAVVIVKGAISSKGVKMPGELLYNKEENYTKELRDKKFVEQWIVSVFLVAFIIVIMNLIIGFSIFIAGVILNAKGDGDHGLITVYLKADEDNSNTAEIPDLPDDLENLQAKDLFAMGNIAFNHTDQPEGQAAMEYIFNTIGSLVNIAHSKFPMKKSLVIAQVVLESGWVSEYYDSNHIKSEYNNIIGINAYDALTSPETTWYKNGHKTVTISMPHLEGSTSSNEPVKQYANLYECIEDYMGQFIYHHPAESFGDYNDITNYQKYIHGYTPTEDAGRDMYVYYSERIKKYNLERFDNMPDTEVGTKNNIKSCYFKTDLEGLYMFESQYIWKGYINILHNFIYIASGFVLCFFKWVLYAIFFIRLFAVGVLIILAPVIIMIDLFKKINGNEGILKKWFIIFLYAVLLKPALCAIYYIMTKINTSLVADNPLYILIVIVAMAIVICVSFTKVKNYIFDK